MSAKKPDHMGLYRARLSCKIACDALDGRIDPIPNASANEYALFNIAKAIEEIAAAMEEMIGEKSK